MSFEDKSSIPLEARYVIRPRLLGIDDAEDIQDKLKEEKEKKDSELDINEINIH